MLFIRASMRSTVRYLGTEVDDALAISEQVDLQFCHDGCVAPVMALRGHARYVPDALAEMDSADGMLPFSDVSCPGLAQPCCAPVTRQITSPTSSATRTEPSGPSVTPTGRPKDSRSSGARKPERMSRGGPDGRPFVNGTNTTL